MELIVRKEQLGDEIPIRRVLTSAFPSQQEANLVDRLHQNGRLSISLVAESNDNVIAHIAFSPVSLTSRIEGGRGVGLAPLAVDPQ